MAFYRKKSALTQQQLGEQLNVSAQAVSKWENDQSEPDIATLCKLAEIYQISVNELVGAEAPVQGAAPENTTVVAPVVMPVIMSAQKKPKKPNPVAKLLKKLWWVLALVAVLAVAGIVFLNIWNAGEPDRMLKKFEKIDLGMTKDEVLAIMGEADEIVDMADVWADKKSDSGVWDEYVAWKQYGYTERDYEYWYYRDAQYEKTEKATKQANKDLDFSYEPEPWTQVRFVFDDDGKLIEAYYNAAFSGGYKTAYGDEEKELDEVIVLSKMSYYESLKEGQSFDFAIYFTDGSVFMGSLPISKKDSKSGPDGTSSVSVASCWGDVDVYVVHVPAGTRVPE